MTQPRRVFQARYLSVTLLDADPLHELYSIKVNLKNFIGQ